MKISYLKKCGNKYLILYLKNIWRKIGKDKNGNWFCAIGDKSGTKRAFHSTSIHKVLIKLFQLKYDPA